MNHNAQKRDRARKLLDSGKFGEALSLLLQNIKDSPTDIDSIYLSGICCAKSGNHALAEKHFKKTVKINKNLFQAYNDLGLSQSFQRKPGDAIRSFKKSLTINPAFAPAHSHIALTYLKTRETRKALHHAKKAVNLDDKNPMYMNVQALCYRQLDQTEKAIATFKKINVTHPGFYGAFHNLYETYRLINDIPNAERVLLSAKSIFRDHVNVYASLGELYEQSNRADDAKDIYAEGVVHCADNPDLLVSLGRVNRILGNLDEGLKQINKVLVVDSAYQSALAERCSFHVLNGEYEQAYALLCKFISSKHSQPLTPGMSIAYAHVCLLTKRYEESIATSRNTLETPGLPDEMKSVVLFSMGDSYDKIKKYDRAFTLYGKANSAVQKKSDIDRYLGILGDIKSSINRDSVENATQSDINTRKPVFIVGMPRSGTSLAEQIISSHRDAYGAGEITELWSIAQDVSKSKTFENYTKTLALMEKESINQCAGRYLDFIENLEPNALRITDKLPHNFMHIGLIKQLFPEAYIIHCHRHPFDICLSIYCKKFNDNHLYARHLSEIARFYAEYRELMKLWDNTPAKIFNLKYEDLVANQEKTTRNIISHIGLDWDEQCLRHHESDRLVTTPSYTQATKPVYSDAINRWKHYKSHLQPLIDVLGDPEQYE